MTKPSRPTGARLAVSGLDDPRYHKSTRSNGQANCLRAATDGIHVLVGDTKDPTGPELLVDGAAWTDFVGVVKSGATDL
jgi:hypothetical protein